MSKPISTCLYNNVYTYTHGSLYIYMYLYVYIHVKLCIHDDHIMSDFPVIELVNIYIKGVFAIFVPYFLGGALNVTFKNLT